MRLRVALVAFVALTASQAHAMGVTSGPDARQMRGMGVVQGGGWSLACLFASSATCSDSRVVTTTRSTAVPCQQSDGTWGTAAINTACIAPGGVAGVESYGAVTNYWTDSNTPASWTANGSVISGNTVTDDSAAASEGPYITKVDSAANLNATWTASCYLRSGTATTAQLVFNTDGTGVATCNLAGLTASAQRFTCSTTLSGTPTFIRPIIRVGTVASDTGSINVDQCQLEKSSTPGRRCDSGGTATTCGADQHTVSTTGWPVDRGEIEFEYRPGSSSVTANRHLLDGRDASHSGALDLLIFAGGSLGGVAGTVQSPTASLDWSGSSYRIAFKWQGASVQVLRDGVQVASGTWGTPGAWGTVATIGARNNVVDHAAGTVRLLYIGEPR